jgi:hypothetical protein
MEVVDRITQGSGRFRYMSSSNTTSRLFFVQAIR